MTCTVILKHIRSMNSYIKHVYSATLNLNKKTLYVILQIPVVSEEFLYESIINKKLQDPDNYYPSA